MSYLNNVLELIAAGYSKFISLIVRSNRELNYHDHHHADETSTANAYVVGTNNVNAHGNQSKRFVSKSTLIYSTFATTVRFNDVRNQANAILANTYYEFKSNIWQVFFSIPEQEGDIYFWFEGVLPEEARSPE